MYGIAYALGQAGQGAVEGTIAADERARQRELQDRQYGLLKNQDARAQAFSDSFLTDANLRRIDEQTRLEAGVTPVGDGGPVIPPTNFSLKWGHPGEFTPGSDTGSSDAAPTKNAMMLTDSADASPPPVELGGGGGGVSPHAVPLGMAGTPTARPSAAGRKPGPAFGGSPSATPADAGGGQPPAKSTRKVLDYTGDAEEAIQRANSNLALARHYDEILPRELEKNPYGAVDQSNPDYQSALRWAARKRDALETARNSAYASALEAKHQADWTQTQGYMRNAALAIRAGDDAAVLKYATPLLGDSAKYLTGLTYDKKDKVYVNRNGVSIGSNEVSALLSGDEGKIIEAAEKFGDYLAKMRNSDVMEAQARAAHVNPTLQLVEAQWKNDYAQYIRDGKTPEEARARADADKRFNLSRALPDAKLQNQVIVAEKGMEGRVLGGALSNPAGAAFLMDPATREGIQRGLNQAVPGAAQPAPPAGPPVNGLSPGIAPMGSQAPVAAPPAPMASAAAAAAPKPAPTAFAKDRAGNRVALVGGKWVPWNQR